MVRHVKPTGIYGHDQQHVGRGTDFVCDGCRWRIWRNPNTGLHVAFMNSTDDGYRISFGASLLEMHGKWEKRRLTSCFYVEGVHRDPCIGNDIDPLGYEVLPICSTRT